MGTYRFFIVLLIAYITFYIPATYSTEHRPIIICTTEECINTASEILSKLDRAVDPCDNFYKFACGGWLQHNRANLSFPKVNIFSLLKRKTENQIREMLEAPNKPNDTLSLLKARQVFAQCMNHNTDKNTSSKTVEMTSSNTVEANSIARAEMDESSRQSNEDDTKWKKCVDNVSMYIAILHEYVKKYASHLENPEYLEDIRKIAADVHNVVREQIRNSTWVDQGTKEAFLEKLEHIKYEFIKPEWFSDEAIDRFYEGLNVSRPYFLNLLNVYKYEKIKVLSLWNSDNTIFSPSLLESMSPQLYYDKKNNKIVVTAVLLQKPVYDRYRLPILNYGALGFIIGHHITQLFDDNYNNVTYSERILPLYKNITQCFIDQYNDYLISGVEDKVIRVNGSLTCPVNMGDSAGIVAAYHTYKNWKADLQETEYRLKGLEHYTDDQIFFLTYAQFFCETVLPEHVHNNIVQNKHLLMEIRVRGSLSNSRKFSEVYNCPLETPMNPKKKCALWF
ncbi:endothelin-converting enzyme 1-like isoform X2 [Pseudomyrmex gracilis]|uniref:endothelin-converting enzyme 1-like isoform X2 n=1 Tax=Pseudomyrmex gracilis TaxID=219809 RepID=UPI000995B387|nr:endothelin-converting enzyme 1-like isoform X2 [Pseudomyrmex gracilis]